MQLNINPEDIDKYVKDALLAATIGKPVTEAIQKCVDNLFKGYNNPIEGIVKNHLNELVREYMNKPEVKSVICEAIAKKLAPQTIESIICYGVAKLQEKMDEYR